MHAKPKVRNILHPAAALLLALSFLGGAPALAQELSTKGGFKIESDDKKYAFQIGGRALFDFNSYNGVLNASKGGDTGSDLFFRETRLEFGGKMGDWTFKTEAAQSQGGSTELRSYIDYTGFETFRWRMGKFKEPFGMEVLASSNKTPFVEMTLPTQFFTPSRNLGVQLSGQAGALNYAVGLFENDSFGRERDDSNAVNFALSGHAYFTPIKEQGRTLLLGGAFSLRESEEDLAVTGHNILVDPNDQFLSVLEAGDVDGYRRRTRPEVHRVDSDNRVSTDYFAVDDVTMINLQALWLQGPLSVSAEYFQAGFAGGEIKIQGIQSTDRTIGDDNGSDSRYIDTLSGDDVDASGYYLQAGWVFNGARSYKSGRAREIKAASSTRPALEIVARYSYLDLSDNKNSELGLDLAGNEARVISLGLNWQASKNVLLKINYLNVEYENEIKDEDTGQALTTRAQIYF